MDGRLAALAAQAAEVEQPVDGALELQCPGLAFFVVLGQFAQPGAAHLHVGDLVGEHPVLTEVQHWVVHVLGEVAHGREHIDRQAFQRAIDTSETKHGIGVAGSLEQGDGLAELADVGAHVVAEEQADLDVASFVPALARHVQLQRERRLGGGVVERSAAGAFHGLDLADEDAVHLPPRPIGHVVRRRIHAPFLTRTVQPLVGEALGCRDPVKAGVAGQGVGRQLCAHVKTLADRVAHSRRGRPGR